MKLDIRSNAEWEMTIMIQALPRTRLIREGIAPPGTADTLP